MTAGLSDSGRADCLFDIAVIGGGVVGCTMARRFTRDGARSILLERAPDILSGASKGNSGLLHTGFDAPSDSEEVRCMQAGRAEYLDIRERLNLPLLETGAMVSAWSEAEFAQLGPIHAKALENGVADVRLLSREEVLEREPQLSPNVLGAVLVPGEHVIDPWSAPLAYLTQAVENGAAAIFDAEVSGGSFTGESWTLATSQGLFQARMVINCAGLSGDLLDETLLGAANFRIKPRKGQFVVLDKSTSAQLRTIILPVPNERTKGIVLSRTIFGNILVGPTAEEQDERTRASVETATLQALLRKAAEIVPSLAGAQVTAVYAGLRPATEVKDYQINFDAPRHWMTVGGIRSTGLTAALGIAQYAAELYRGSGPAETTPLAAPFWPMMRNLAEHLPRNWQETDHGKIVCHCELVTEGDIKAALSGPPPARDFGGLRRRSRACMGRCQGFNCMARVACLSQNLLATPLAMEPQGGH